MPIITLYHYAREENLDSISDEGIQPGSKFFMFEVPSRDNAVYCWQTPDFDVMGYADNPKYVGLKVQVDSTRCKVAPMELVAAAYANHTGNSRTRKNAELAERLVQAYERAQVPYFEYNTGLFRAPEVLVEGAIDPDDIATFRATDVGTRGEENRRVYAGRWAEKLIQLLNIQRTLMNLQELTQAAQNRGAAVRVAEHDDATAWLETYMLPETSEFFTIEKED